MGEGIAMTDRFIVQTEDEGKRIDLFLAERLFETSRSKIQKLIENGLVTIDDEPVKKNYRVVTGDEVIAEDIEEKELPAPMPEDIPLDIEYEDDYILVVNKPAGMAVHPSEGNQEGTLVNALLFHCGNNLSSNQGIYRPGIVHRIDKDTSGLLVVAKDDASHEFLEQMIQTRKLERTYVAIVRDNINTNEGIIDEPIGRDPKNRMKRAVVQGGRRAITRYNVIERFGRATLVELQLDTGRTHQIRVHMAATKHPIIGDAMYGGAGESYGAKRQMLHSVEMRFSHPHSKVMMDFVAALPSDFEEVLTRLRKDRT